MALCAAMREAAWMKQLLCELGVRDNEPIIVHGDNHGCQAMAQNRTTDARAKHIDVRYQYTRDRIQDGTVKLEYCRTSTMLAD